MSWSSQVYCFALPIRVSSFAEGRAERREGAMRLSVVISRSRTVTDLPGFFHTQPCMGKVVKVLSSASEGWVDASGSGRGRRFVLLPFPSPPFDKLKTKLLLTFRSPSSHSQYLYEVDCHDFLYSVRSRRKGARKGRQKSASLDASSSLVFKFRFAVNDLGRPATRPQTYQEVFTTFLLAPSKGVTGV